MEKDTPFLEGAPGPKCVYDRMSLPYLGRQAGSDSTGGGECSRGVHGTLHGGGIQTNLGTGRTELLSPLISRSRSLQTPGASSL